MASVSPPRAARANMLSLHKAFPQILGTHPVSSKSDVSSVGTSSKLKTYGHNRADDTLIPGDVIRDYVVIKPDFPECIDDFGFLWFEDEYVIGVAGKWILAAHATDAGPSRRTRAASAGTPPGAHLLLNALPALPRIAGSGKAREQKVPRVLRTRTDNRPVDCDHKPAWRRLAEMACLDSAGMAATGAGQVPRQSGSTWRWASVTQ